MPRVAILRRDKAVTFPDTQQVEEWASVTYSTSAVGPRVVHLGLELYRQATEEELSANPAYQLVPVDEEAEQAERRAIEQDLDRAMKAPLTSFDL